MAHLCKTCQKFPFDPNLEAFSSTKQRRWTLGTFGDIHRRRCSFCQLVALACIKHHNTSDETKSPKYGEEIAVKFEATSRLFDVEHFGLGAQIHMAQSDGVDTYKALVAREELDEWIDFSEVKRWIMHCDAKHCVEKYTDDACMPLPFNPAVLPRTDKRQLDIRLVDVDDLCITYAPLRAKYIALSYVWGQSNKPRLKLMSFNEEELSKSGALRTKWPLVPNTIRDAISVARQLGERYLWIDSLCILQDDAYELQESVAVMDLFYEMASFTIIAAGGKDAFAGLEGVQPTRRITRPNPVQEIIPGLKMTVVDTSDLLLRQSMYNTRAWTMQEELLSHRALVFIAGQVFWHCECSYFNERVHSPKEGKLSDHGSNAGSFFSLLLTAMTIEASLNAFGYILLYYTTRTLSYETDILRAAQGILRKFSTLSGDHCFEGLAQPLDCSLLFVANNKSWSRGFERRRGFPSYSWTGWTFNPRYHPSTEAKAKQMQSENRSSGNPSFSGWIVWHCKFKDGQTYQINPRGRFYKATRPKFQIEMAQRFDEAGDIPVSVSDNYLPVTTPYPLLIFWTVVINLRLQSGKQKPGYPGGFLRCEALDKFFEVVCEDVDMDAPITKGEMTVGKFAILTAHEDRFSALLLHWEDGIMERRGVAWLKKGALERCLEPGPRWRDIVLG